MPSGLVFPEAFLDHEIDPGHPESPGRLRAVAERIRRAGLGYTINVDLGAGATDKAMLDAWDREFLAQAEAFRPELILISAGFDSRKDDWLGDFRIGDDTFRRLTRLAMGLADRSAGSRVVSLLEGGYNPAGLADAVAAHLEILVSD